MTYHYATRVDGMLVYRRMDRADTIRAHARRLWCDARRMARGLVQRLRPIVRVKYFGAHGIVAYCPDTECKVFIPAIDQDDTYRPGLVQYIPADTGAGVDYSGARAHAIRSGYTW